MSIKTHTHCFIPESPSALPVRVTLTFPLSSVLPNPNPPVDKPQHFLLRFHVFSVQSSVFAETLLTFRWNFDQPTSQMQMCSFIPALPSHHQSWPLYPNDIYLSTSTARYFISCSVYKPNALWSVGHNFSFHSSTEDEQ